MAATTALAGLQLASPSPAPADDATTRILIVGDSVTQGSAGDFTWRYRLWQHLEAQTGTTVDFVGPREDLFDNIANAQGSMDYVDPAFDRDHAARWGQSLEVQDVPVGDLVTRYEPDIVVEMLGVNDLTWGTAPPEVVEQRLRSFAREARSAAPSVGLVLVRVPQTWATGASAFNERVEGIAADFDGPDARATTADPDVGFEEWKHTWDPAHPNAAGEVLIAASVADALAEQGVGSPFARPLPQVPLGPRVAPVLSVAAGDRRADLTWTRPPGATDEYVWVRDLTIDEAWRQLPYSLKGTSWSDEGLVNGHRYAYKLQPVKGYWAAEDDVRSEVVEVVPQPPPPREATVPDLTPLSHALSVNWPDVVGATSYELTWWPADDTTTTGTQVVTTPSATIPSLLAGRRYAVSIRALNGGGAGPASPIATATPLGPRPAAPRRLDLSAGRGRRLHVEWRPAARATRYEVQFRSSSSTRWVTAGWTQRTHLTTSRVARGHRYAVRVRSWHQYVAGHRTRSSIVVR